jgi:hypothetical protein
MSENSVVARAAAWPIRRGGAEGSTGSGAQAWAALSFRRWLQLGLAAIWLLDAILQLQSFMFSKGFSQTLSATAPGNPGFIAGPINWSARLIADHPTWTNAAFASVQLFLAVGIAWRPSVKVALAASIAWALGVWWLGEGLGGMLNGTGDPVMGGPGAVIIYAILAVLLWPTDRDGPFEAARPLGAHVARGIWLILWGSLAVLAVEPASSRTPQAMHDMIAGMAAGEPGWIASLDRNAANLVAGQGATVAIIVAVALALVAVGVFLPAPGARAALVLAVVLAAVIWVVGENFGAILSGSGTDPNTGPLLMLLAAAYWPATGWKAGRQATP